MEMLVSEIWKNVVGWEDIYSVSDHGRVRRDLPWKGMSKNRDMIKKLSFDKDGYLITVLSKLPIHTTKKVHSLVAESFIGKKPFLFEVNHKDGVKTNNNVENLEYVTSKENIRHSWKLGLSKARYGERNSYSKLTERLVRKIRNLNSKNKLNQCEMARNLGVNHVTIWKIVNRRTWAHIEN